MARKTVSQPESEQADDTPIDGRSAKNAIISQLSYEAAAEKLEAILSALETGDLSLEKSLALYEEGSALAAHCEEKLDQAELGVRQWQPDGAPTPFNNWQDEIS